MRWEKSAGVMRGGGIALPPSMLYAPADARLGRKVNARSPWGGSGFKPSALAELGPPAYTALPLADLEKVQSELLLTRALSLS